MDVSCNDLNQEELVLTYKKVKDMIVFLDNEIETSEVEKETK